MKGWKRCLKYSLYESALKKINQTIICLKNKHRFVFKTQEADRLDNMNYWKVKSAERFTRNFKQILNKSVLEVGTNNGYIVLSLVKLGAEIIACDIMIKNLLICFNKK